MRCTKPLRHVGAPPLSFSSSTHGIDGCPCSSWSAPPTLRHHAGQITLPGGGSEPHDPTVVDTALREAGEEAGIPPDAAEVIGLLPPFLTAVSNIWLTPVVALQGTDVDLRPDPFEVARLFRVDLRTLMEVPHIVRTVIHEGVSREVHTYEADGNVIWGVTAAILFELISRLGGDLA